MGFCDQSVGSATKVPDVNEKPAAEIKRIVFFIKSSPTYQVGLKMKNTNGEFWGLFILIIGIVHSEFSKLEISAISGFFERGKYT